MWWLWHSIIDTLNNSIEKAQTCSILFSMMQKNKKTLSYFEWVILVLLIAVVFGAIIRFLPGLRAGFPLNDGGMFLSMIQDLKVTDYSLPKFTSYNQLQIPYAYPPFGFYFTRIISDIFRIPVLDLLRWLPPTINIFSIFAFYYLAAEILGSKFLASLASAFYALTPGSFGWFIMGGGITRSFGSLFLLISVFAVYRLFRSSQKKYIALSILFCGLTVLSHPEAGVHLAAACILLWLFFGRTLHSFRDAVLVGLGVLLFSSPWWWTVLSYHGLNPFLSALQTGSYRTPLWLAFYKAISGEEIIPVLSILRLLGVAWAIWKKQYFLIAWTFLPYLIEPRSAPSVTLYPLTMLIALAFAEAIPFFISRIRRIELSLDNLYKNRFYNSFLFILLIYLFVDSGLYGFRLVGNSLKPAELQALGWTKENVAARSKFLALTGIVSPEIDPFIEWFPAITEQQNQSTIQGYEWLLGEKFFERYSDLSKLQQCDSVTCVETWSVRTGLDYQYIVIVKKEVKEELLRSFEAVDTYTPIYNKDDVIIYRK